VSFALLGHAGRVLCFVSLSGGCGVTVFWDLFRAVWCVGVSCVSVGLEGW